MGKSFRYYGQKHKELESKLMSLRIANPAMGATISLSKYIDNACESAREKVFIVKRIFGRTSLIDNNRMVAIVGTLDAFGEARTRKLPISAFTYAIILSGLIQCTC
jgi:hypothetical protein